MEPVCFYLETNLQVSNYLAFFLNHERNLYFPSRERLEKERAARLEAERRVRELEARLEEAERLLQKSSPSNVSSPSTATTAEEKTSSISPPSTIIDVAVPVSTFLRPFQPSESK